MGGDPCLKGAVKKKKHFLLQRSSTKYVLLTTCSIPNHQGNPYHFTFVVSSLLDMEVFF